MNSLTENQIERVVEAIEAEKVYSSSLKNEIIDHTCCSIEEKMGYGISFENALKEAIESFGVKGLYKIESEIQTQKKRKSILKKLRLGTTSIAACLILLVLAVDAQERPEIKPLDPGQFRISSSFGKRIDPFDRKEKFHRGIDLAVPVGTPVKATADGVVTKVEKGRGWGLLIRLKHGDDYVTSYAQLSESKVDIGQVVKKGDIIALSGNSGRSTAPHLHYEVIRNGQPVDPELYFSE